MSDVSNIDLRKWTGLVKAELIKTALVTDDMSEIRDLNDAAQCKVYKTVTGDAGEVASGADRTTGSGGTDKVATLQHQKSIEVNEPIVWEDEMQVPLDRIEAKMPSVGQKMVQARARRFIAYLVGTTSNFDGGPSTPNHIISKDFSSNNAALNAEITRSCHTSRNLLIKQGFMPDPDNTFAFVEPDIFARFFTISEIKGHEFNFRGNAGQTEVFRAFRYANITWLESPVGFTENLNTSSSFGYNSDTPSKYKIDLTNYRAIVWDRRGLAQGFVNGGWRDGIPAPNESHINLDVRYQWWKKKYWIMASMIWDIAYIYENSDGDENVGSVAWKTTA